MQGTKQLEHLYLVLSERVEFDIFKDFALRRLTFAFKGRFQIGNTIGWSNSIENYLVEARPHGNQHRNDEGSKPHVIVSPYPTGRTTLAVWSALQQCRYFYVTFERSLSYVPDHRAAPPRHFHRVSSAKDCFRFCFLLWRSRKMLHPQLNTPPIC